MSGRVVSLFQTIRDGVLLLAGLALLGYETVFVPEPRTVIIGVAVTMLGIPGTLLSDRVFRKHSDE